eukprot:7026632-Ditylum_brightwellii.AAC.1
MNTAPIIRQVLCYKVAQWYKLTSGPPPRLPTDAAAEILSAAVELQQELGLHNFIKGRMAKKWCLAQA